MRRDRRQDPPAAKSAIEALFSHVDGLCAQVAGASVSGYGLVAEADSGTLFLDEIDVLPPSAQIKLLRLLQEKEYRPLGSSRRRHANVRFLAACNQKSPAAAPAGPHPRRFLFPESACCG